MVWFCFVGRNSTISLFHLTLTLFLPAWRAACCLPSGGQHTSGIMAHTKNTGLQAENLFAESIISQAGFQRGGKELPLMT